MAQDLFSLLPDAKVKQGERVLSISGGLRQNRDFKFIDKLESTKPDTQPEQEEIDDGVITIKKSELVNKEDYEREKMRQVSRAEFQAEQMQTLNRMMPNKDDRAKNNLRALAFDISGTIEQDRIKSQKSFMNAKKKYGW